MADHSDREILHDILSGVDELLAESRKGRQELHDVRQELDDRYKNGDYGDFGYHVRLEQVARSHQTLNFYIRKLEQQKKIALQKLRELE